MAAHAIGHSRMPGHEERGKTIPVDPSPRLHTYVTAEGGDGRRVASLNSRDDSDPLGQHPFVYAKV